MVVAESILMIAFILPVLEGFHRDGPTADESSIGKRAYIVWVNVWPRTQCLEDYAHLYVQDLGREADVQVWLPNYLRDEEGKLTDQFQFWSGFTQNNPNTTWGQIRLWVDEWYIDIEQGVR